MCRIVTFSQSGRPLRPVIGSSPPFGGAGAAAALGVLETRYRRGVPAARTLPATWFRTDLITAALLALAGVEMTLLMHGAGTVPFSGPLPAVIAGGAALALPLIVRRRYPAAVALVQAAIYIGFGATVGIEIYASQVSLFLGLYSVGAWDANRRRALWTRVVVVIAMGAWLVFEAVNAFWDPETGERGVNAYLSVLGIMLAINAAYFGGAWVFGNRAWDRALEQQELDRAHAEIRAQQDHLAANEVSLERVRIARELHDVVAHHVSSMGVQAAAARRLLTRDPDRAATSLRGIEDSARQTIAELQALVHTLRDGEDGPAPLPTLAALPDLVEHSRSLGQRVELERIGEPPPLSTAGELTLFRVAQEALTNARKHAGPQARVHLRVRSVEDGVEVEVSDDGRGALERSVGTGTGLVGMCERVRAVGGQVSAGAKSNGGWLVRAWVPAASPATSSATSSATSPPTSPVDSTAREGMRPS